MVRSEDSAVADSILRLSHVATIASHLRPAKEGLLLLITTEAMPPHLHPRSRLTTSLFTSCLAVSFLVVGMPHILPCPVNPRAYAEGDMEGLDHNGRRRRRRKPNTDQNITSQLTAGEMPEGASEAVGSGAPVNELEVAAMRRKRECPVPKPRGLVGQIMGFKSEDRDRDKPIVRVEPLRARGSEKSS